MSTAFLNGQFMPISEARISPMDRGFLFGDGIYEVIPSYDGKFVGFQPHLERMQAGLKALEIPLALDFSRWLDIAQQLVASHRPGATGIYIHVSRGMEMRRNHAYPQGIEPTVFAFAFDIPPARLPDKAAASCYRVSTCEDLRWRRCHIKSTALLGNVMHLQGARAGGQDETLLYNVDRELTEAAACNVYVVKDAVVATPALDDQKLPGITRYILLDLLRKHSDLRVEERIVTLDEVAEADEVWLTSSSKEIAPVLEVDGLPVGDGRVGDVWLQAQALYHRYKFDY